MSPPGTQRSTSFYDYLLLLVAFVYLLAGNAARFRFTEELGIGRAVPVTEFILVLVALLGIWRLWRLPRVLLGGAVFICGAVLLSSVYGIVQHGFVLFPVSYAARFVAQVAAGLLCGISLANVIGRDVARLIRWVLGFYAMHCIVGLVLIAVFPQSDQLWQALERVGIIFAGDPHTSRFYSTYFDPNYMAAIMVMPAVFSLCMIMRSGEWYYWVGFFLVGLCTVLCFSRSGFAALLLGIGWVLWVERSRLQSNSWLAFRLGVLAMGAFMMAAALALIMDEQVEYFWSRFAGLTTDESALGRYRSFENALLLWREFPLLGVGYNYASLYTLSTRGLTAEDSSIMSMFSNFGVIGFGYLFLVTARCWWLGRARLTMFPADSLVRTVWAVFTGYALICTGFSAQFNNLLFYSFWVLPVLAIGAYLIIAHSQETSATGNAVPKKWRPTHAH